MNSVLHGHTVNQQPVTAKLTQLEKPLHRSMRQTGTAHGSYLLHSGAKRDRLHKMPSVLKEQYALESKHFLRVTFCSK